MAELSNLLHQRLAVAEAPPVHPDADTMTAYVERLLPAGERKQVLEHISACSQCREVMALSLPEQSAIAVDGAAVVALPGIRRKRSFWTPALGLAASVAAVAIVAVLLIELPKTSTGRLEEAKQQNPATPVVPDDKAKDAITAQPEARTEALVPTTAAGPVSATRGKESFNDRLPASAPVDKKQIATLNLARADIGMRAANNAYTAYEYQVPRQDYMNSQMFTVADTQNGAINTAANELPGAPSPHIVTNQLKAGFLNNSIQLREFADLPSQTPGTKSVRTISSTSTSGHSGFPLLSNLERGAKQLIKKRPTPAIPPEGFAFTAMGGAGQLNPALEKDALSETATVMAPAPEKPGAGELDHSGAFSRRARSESAPAMTMERAKKDKDEAPQLSWKITGDKLLKLDDSGAWTEGYSGAAGGIEFSAVSAHGHDVWAGGAHATLLHSQDGGATWEKVRMDAWVSGTITAIVANGPNIQVKTSANQTCVSQDSGKTWALQ